MCAEDYVPGIKYSCHKCSERSPGSDVGPMLTTLLVFVAILVVVLSYLLAVVKVDSRAERYQNEAQGSWEWAASSTYKFLLKMFPLTSIKVVLVVWQILTQVSVGLDTRNMLRLCCRTQLARVNSRQCFRCQNKRTAV